MGLPKIGMLVEAEYKYQTDSFAASPQYQSLRSGSAGPSDYNAFIERICETHLKSPQILAFLYSLAPPSVADNLKHNMLEELGLDKSGVSHPDLLIALAEATGLDAIACCRFRNNAQEELRRLCIEPILFSSFSEFGLAILLEVTSFEWMLSRLARDIATFLKEHHGIPAGGLEWFLHHSEVDIKHAAEGVQAVVEYGNYYEFEEREFRSILELTFRENVLLKRYFGLHQPISSRAKLSVW